MDIIIKYRSIAEVPVFELYGSGGTVKKPIVFLYHGSMCRKEFILKQAYDLATNGFYVIVPDAFGHGERSREHVTDLFTAITKTVGEVDKLIDSFQEHTLADNKRVGIAGYSMGGCITFDYLVNGKKQIKAAVTIISTPVWTSIVDAFSTKERIQWFINLGILKREEDIVEYRNLAEKIQPINFYPSMKDVPLLMLSGENDNDAPVHGVIELYEKLLPLTKNKETLRYKVYPSNGHEDTMEMNMDMADWFKQYL